MRIERQVNNSTVRLFIERHTIVITRKTDEDVNEVLREVIDVLTEFLKDDKPKKIWWKFMRR